MCMCVCPWVVQGHGTNKGEDHTTVVYLPAWTVDPDNGWYPNWQMLLLSLSVVVGLIVPFNIAYLDPSDYWEVPKLFVYVTDAAFLLDVGLSFFVPKFQHGEWKTDLADIAPAYAQGMLCYDVVAAVPWDVAAILVLRPPEGAELLFFVSLGFLRLLRLQRLWMFLWEAGSDFRFNYFSVSIQKFTFLTAYAVHWAACVFFFLARTDDFASYTWVGRCEPSLAFAPPMEAYVTSLYWAMTTLSTTGYGDLSAYTMPERMWTVFFMLVNLALTAYVIGNMTVLLTKADAAVATYRDRLTSVTGYMTAHQVGAWEVLLAWGGQTVHVLFLHAGVCLTTRWDRHNEKQSEATAKGSVVALRFSRMGTNNYGRGRPAVLEMQRVMPPPLALSMRLWCSILSCGRSPSPCSSRCSPT